MMAQPSSLAFQVEAFGPVDLAESPFEAPPSRALLAARNAETIALANADALVIDATAQRIWRGSDRVEFGTVKRWGQLFTVCMVVTAHLGRELQNEDLIEALWSEDPEGGPLDTYRHISALLYQARPFLRWAGIAVHRPYFFHRIAVTPAERRVDAFRSFGISNSRIFPCGVAR